MGKKQVLSFATPKGDKAGSTAERPDVVAKAIEQASQPEKKKTRSRDGMVSMAVWMKPEARKNLKMFAMSQDKGQEEFFLDALNAYLIAQGADFVIE